MANPDAAAREALTIVAILGAILAFSLFTWAYKRNRNDGEGRGNDDGKKERKRFGDDDGKKDRDRNERDNKDKRDDDKRNTKKDEDNKKPPDTPASTNYDPSKDKPSDSDDDDSKGGGDGGDGPGSGPSSYLDSTFQLAPDLKLKIRSSSDDPPMSITYHGDPPSSGGSDGAPGFGGGGGGGPPWDSRGGPPTDASWEERENGYGYGGGWYPGGGGGPAIPVGGMPGNPQTASLPVEQAEHGGRRRPPFDPVMLGTARTPGGFDNVHVAFADVPALRQPKTPVAIPRYKPFREVPSLISSSSSSPESEIMTPLTPLEVKTAFMPSGMEIDPFTYSSAKPAKAHFSARDLHNDQLEDLQDILQGREKEGIDLRPRRLSELLEVPGLGETLGPAGGDRYNPTMFGELKQGRREDVPFSPIRFRGGMSPIDLNPVYIEEKGERVTNLSPLKPGIPAESGERVKRREKVRNGLVSPRAVNLPTPVAEESQREEERSRRKERQKQEIGVPDDYEKARVKTRKERERERIPISPERAREKAKKMRKQKVKVVDRNTGRVKTEEILVTDSEAEAEKILSPGRRTAKVRIRGTVGESEEEALYERERSRRKKEKLRMKIRNDESEEEITVDEDGRRVKKKKKRRVPLSEDEEERVRLRRKKERNAVSFSDEEDVRADRRRAKARERLRNGRVGVYLDEEEEEPLYERYTDRNGRPKLRKIQHDDPYQEFYRQRNRERVRGGRGIEEYEEDYEMDGVRLGGQGRMRRRIPQQPVYQDDSVPLRNIPNYQQQGQQVLVDPILAQRRQLHQATIEEELARENPSLSRAEREEMARLRIRNYESGRNDRLDRAILEEEGSDSNISVKERERLAKLRLQHMDAEEEAFTKEGRRLGQKEGPGGELQTKQQHLEAEDEERQVRGPGQRRRIQNDIEGVELEDTSVESAEKTDGVTLGHAERVNNAEVNVTAKPKSPQHEVLVRPERPQGPNQQNRRQFALRQTRRLNESDDEGEEPQAETGHANRTVPLNVKPGQEQEIFELPAEPVGQRRASRVEDVNDVRQEIRSEAAASRKPAEQTDNGNRLAQQAPMGRTWDYWNNVIDARLDSRVDLTEEERSLLQTKATKSWYKRLKRLEDSDIEQRGTRLLEDLVDDLISRHERVKQTDGRGEGGLRSRMSEPDTHTRQGDREISSLPPQSETRGERRRRHERSDEASYTDREVLDLSELNDEQIEEYEKTGRLPPKAAQREDREDTAAVRPTLAHQARDDHVEQAGKRSDMQLTSMRSDPIPDEEADAGAPDVLSTTHSIERQAASAFTGKAERPAERSEDKANVRLTAPDDNFSLYEDERYKETPAHAEVRPVIGSEKEYNNPKPIPEEIAVGEKPGGYDSGYGTDEDREIEVHERSVPPKISINPKDHHDDGNDPFAHTGRVRPAEHTGDTGRPRVPREFREEYGRWAGEGDDPIDTFREEVWNNEFENIHRGARGGAEPSDPSGPVRNESTEEPRKEREESRGPIGGDDGTSWDWPADLPDPRQDEGLQVHQTSIPEYKIGKDDRSEQALSDVAPTRRPETKRPAMEAPHVPVKETSRADDDDLPISRRSGKEVAGESRSSPVKAASEDDDEGSQRRAGAMARPRDDEETHGVLAHPPRERKAEKTPPDAQVTRDPLRHARRAKKEDDDDEPEDPGVSIGVDRPGPAPDEDGEPQPAGRPVDATQGGHRKDGKDLFEHTKNVVPATYTGNALPGQKEERPSPDRRASIEKTHRQILNDFQKQYSSNAPKGASFEDFQRKLLRDHQQQPPLQVHTAFVPDVEPRDVGRFSEVDSTFGEENTPDVTEPLNPPYRKGTKPTRVPVRSDENSDADVRGDRVRSRDVEEADEPESNLRMMGHERRNGPQSERKENKAERCKEVSEDYYQSDAEDDVAQNHGRRRVRSDRGGRDSPPISPLSPESRRIVDERDMRREERFRNHKAGVDEYDVSDEDRGPTRQAKVRKDGGKEGRDEERGGLEHRRRGGRRAGEQEQEKSQDEMQAGQSRRDDRRVRAERDTEESEENNGRDTRNGGRRNAQFGHSARRSRRDDEKSPEGRSKGSRKAVIDDEDDDTLIEDDRAQKYRRRPNQASATETSEDEEVSGGEERGNTESRRGRRNEDSKADQGRRDGRGGRRPALDDDTDTEQEDSIDRSRRPRDVGGSKDGVNEPDGTTHYDNRRMDDETSDSEVEDGTAANQTHRSEDRRTDEAARRARIEDEQIKANAEESRNNERRKMEEGQARSIEKQQEKLKHNQESRSTGDVDEEYMRDYNVSGISWNPRAYVCSGIDILKKAPIGSTCSIVGFVIYVEITRQLFSLLHISSGSSSSTSSGLTKRGVAVDELGLDLQITGNWFSTLFGINQADSNNFFIWIQLWNILCIPLLGLCVHRTLERASNPDYKRSAIWSKVNLWTILRMSIFTGQLVATVLVFRQTMSLAYLSGTGSTTSTFSSFGDVSSTVKSLSEFAAQSTNSQVFGIVNFILMVLLLSLGVSLYALIYPRKRAGENSRALLKWIALGAITATFLCCVFYFQEIANYLIQSQNARDTQGSSGAIVLIGGNVLYIVLLPAMGYVAYEVGKTWDRKFPNGFFNRRGTSGGGGGNSSFSFTDC